MTPDGHKWLYIAPNGLRCLQMALNISKWLITSINSKKWLQTGLHKTGNLRILDTRQFDPHKTARLQKDYSTSWGNGTGCIK